MCLMLLHVVFITSLALFATFNDRSLLKRGAVPLIMPTFFVSDGVDPCRATRHEMKTEICRNWQRGRCFFSGMYVLRNTPYRCTYYTNELFGLLTGCWLPWTSTF